MEQKMMQLLNDMEASWWYRGRAAVVRSLVRRGCVQRKKTALDFGAGYGAMYQQVADLADHAYAFEPDASARGRAAVRGYASVFSDAESALKERYDLIALFDVIEHVEDDAALLAKLHAAVSPGGTLVITTPAYQWLWSEIDEQNMHFRRYGRSELLGKIRGAGFEITVVTYWDTFLFPLAALLRLMGRSGESALALPSALDHVLFALVKIEAFVVRRMSLPFGLSLAVVARKPA